MVTLEADSAVVVFSGGQDSTTCLFWARERFSNVQALSFDYGQRHAVELVSAAKIAGMAGVPHTIAKLPIFDDLGANALTSNTDVCGDLTSDGLPNTFVPGRNLFFLTYAAAWAYSRGIRNIVTGVAQTDYSGYPDCREDTLAALQQSLQLGMEANFKLHMPLMHLSKAETVTLAQQHGGLDALAYSHTCYNGQFPPCGDCPACQLRSKGFAEAGVADPLVVRANADV